MVDGDSAFIQSDIRKILAMFKLYQFKLELSLYFPSLP
jgi:hypothetical protein